MHGLADISRARTVGYDPRYNRERGLQETMAAMRGGVRVTIQMTYQNNLFLRVTGRSVRVNPDDFFGSPLPPSLVR